MYFDSLYLSKAGAGLRTPPGRASLQAALCRSLRSSRGPPEALTLRKLRDAPRRWNLGHLIGKPIWATAAALSPPPMMVMASVPPGPGRWPVPPAKFATQRRPWARSRCGARALDAAEARWSSGDIHAIMSAGIAHGREGRVGFSGELLGAEWCPRGGELDALLLGLGDHLVAVVQQSLSRGRFRHCRPGLGKGVACRRDDECRRCPAGG